MSYTAERDPAFDIDISEIRVGPVDGFYPVASLEKPGETQFWAPHASHHFDMLNLAYKLEQEEVKPDYVLGFSRGGLSVAEVIAYSNGYRLVGTMQTEGYDKKTNKRYETPKILGLPDPKVVKMIFKEEGIDDPLVLIADDLADYGDAVDVGREWSVEELGVRPERIKVAVLYDKRVVRARQPVDFSLRLVTHKWVDHERQAPRWRRNLRLAELECLGRSEGLSYVQEIGAAANFLAQQPSDPALMERLIAQSAAKPAEEYKVSTNGDS